MHARFRQTRSHARPVGEAAVLAAVGMTVGPVVVRSRVVVVRPRRIQKLVVQRRRLVDALAAQAGASLVGVSIIERTVSFRVPREGRCVELIATALSVESGAYPHFRTTWDGCRVVELLRAGWFPRDVIFAGICTYSERSMRDTIIRSRSSVNQEFPGATEAMTAARTAVRDEIVDQAAVGSSHGVLLDGAIDADWYDEHSAAVATATANSIVRHDPPTSAPSVAHAIWLN